MGSNTVGASRGPGLGRTLRIATHAERRAVFAMLRVFFWHFVYGLRHVFVWLSTRCEWFFDIFCSVFDCSVPSSRFACPWSQWLSGNVILAPGNPLFSNIKNTVVLLLDYYVLLLLDPLVSLPTMYVHCTVQVGHPSLPPQHVHCKSRTT